MRVSHAASGASLVFDDPTLVSCGGLPAVMGLAQKAGLHELVEKHVHIDAEGGANPHLKIPALVAKMCVGADSIDDMDVLRHGAMSRLFTGARAPSTLGTFLRTLTFGHVRQLDAVASRFLTGLAAHAPLLAGADAVAFLDIDDTLKQTYGYAKQGAGYGYTGVKGLNALIATVSTPTGAPVIAATRLRKGSANSARGATKLLCDALTTARKAGATGLVIVRADSAYYSADIVAACRRAGARYSITTRQDPAVRSAISSIGEDKWVGIKYPEAVWDDEGQCWISDAEIAETHFTAFTGRLTKLHATGRLIVRRVKRLNPKASSGGGSEQDVLFDTYRYHACFTDSQMTLVQAESQHRGHAIVEQVHADLKAGPLAHLPSGSFAANAGWLACAAMSYNLLRAAGTLASAFHAKATTATLRAHLVNIPARAARSARRITLHLPTDWPWQHALHALADAVHPPPRPA